MYGYAEGNLVVVVAQMWVEGKGRAFDGVLRSQNGKLPRIIYI